MERHASCSCGRLRLTACGEPVRISICHCLACQRRTGSMFGAQARFPDDAVTITGESREYVRVGDSGGVAAFHFCPDCGATVFYTLRDIPGFVSVPIGAFADPRFPPPRVSIYEERRHAWVSVPEDAERHD
ncbi:MAG: hypothetical protein AMXMBFR59_20720 [Rhodanobacteraceae bacterium]